MRYLIPYLLFVATGVGACREPLSAPSQEQYQALPGTVLLTSPFLNPLFIDDLDGNGRADVIHHGTFVFCAAPEADLEIERRRLKRGYDCVLTIQMQDQATTLMKASRDLGMLVHDALSRSRGL